MRLFLALFFGFIAPALHSAEIIGLDSLNLGERVEVLVLKKSVYTGEIDTNIIYIRIYDNPESDKPSMLVKGGEYSDNYVYISNDSLSFYIDSTMEFFKIKTDILEHNTELATFNNYIIKKINPYNSLKKYSNRIHLESKSEIRPETNEIYHSYGFRHSNGVESGVELHIDSKNFDRLEYKNFMIVNGDTTDIANSHCIFQKSKDSITFIEMEHYFVKELPKYKERDGSPQRDIKTKRIAVGDIIDLDYTLTGLNKEDMNLKDFFKENEFLFLYVWGAWFRPSLDNSVNMEQFAKELKQPGFITIISDKKEVSDEKFRTYIKREKPNYPVYSNFEFVKNCNVFRLPTLVVIDKNGVVLDLVAGGISKEFPYQKILDKYNKK